MQPELLIKSDVKEPQFSHDSGVRIAQTGFRYSFQSKPTTIAHHNLNTYFLGSVKRIKMVPIGDAELPVNNEDAMIS